MWMTRRVFVFVYLYFSRGGRPSTTCCYGFVGEGEKVVLSMNWTSFFGPQHRQSSSSTFVPPPGGWVRWRLCKGGETPGLQYPSFSWYNRTWTFHCIAPFLTSLLHTAAVFMVIDSFAASTPVFLSVLLPLTRPHTSIHNTHQSSLIRSHYQYWVWEWVSVCECMFVCVCVAKMYWRTLQWVCFQGYCSSFLFLKGP